ncbi:GNAT family N-acetyltransferase [Peribacillus sp. SCS-155]|uniref:GNAT family N-acetyltransferase n=1 Tax=Peribacillus sedimenti TaxID=3115297 RepID=UPI003905FCCF
MEELLLTNGEFYISTNKKYLDIGVIEKFLADESYWAQGRPRSVIEKSITNSTVCFGIYIGNPKEGAAQQIGFARVVSDLATFAYLADVFILKQHRGQGLSKWLVKNIVEHPELSELRRFMLATNDAHTLYSQFGFKPLSNTERYMEIMRSTDY